MFVYMSDVLKNRHKTIIMAYLFQESPEGHGISPLTHLRVAGGGCVNVGSLDYVIIGPITCCNIISSRYRILIYNYEIYKCHL